jgi:tRNA pseudouridine38-40 synthase
VVRDGPFLVVDVRAGGFPRQLVRRLVTAVEAVARGRREPAFLDRALGPTPLEGPEGIAPAAPEPLVLADVAYPSVAFEVDEPAAAAARDVFAERRRRRLAAARVANSIRSLGP